MLKKALAPIIILAIGLATSQAMMALKQEPQRKKTERPAPSVEWVALEVSHPQVTIKSQGTVKPRQQITLNSDVSGEVVWVAEGFLKGQFVKKGEPLIKIDRSSYELALANAKTLVAEAELKLAEEQTRFQQIQQMNQGKNRNSSATRLPIKLAEARLQASKTQLQQAEQDLADTVIRAPFDSLVQAKHVDVGQVINSQSAVAELAGTDMAEVRLAVSPHDIVFIAPALVEKQVKLQATLQTEVGGKEYQWLADINRMDGEIDPVSRVFYLTAEVEKPYQAKTSQQPLPFGLFVNASITLPVIDDVMEIPATALYEQDMVYLLGDNNRLKKNPVKVMRREENRVLVRDGLASGDKIIITRLDLIFDDMAVTPKWAADKSVTP